MAAALTLDALRRYAIARSLFKPQTLPAAVRRLGFADDAIRGWFAAAGLDLDRTERLEGGELTVILWRGIKPGAARQERAAA